MDLNTARDYRILGKTIDDYWERISNIEYGFYKVDEDQAEVFKIIEEMDSLQRHFNKGIRLIGWESKQKKVEIYNKNEHQEKLDQAMRDFSL